MTGCTDGIGKSYTKMLAKNGMNIILMSRTFDKLKKFSEELSKCMAERNCNISY